MLGQFFSYGAILQVLALLHFFRRRPDGFWFWVIIFFGGVGAVIYIVAEVIPDIGLLRPAMQVYPRRKRIRYLEAAILDNPSIGNYEELGDLYLEDKKYAQARECYDRVIAARADSPDPFYRRALAALEMNDFSAATADLEIVVARDPKYDYQRAAGLLAHALGKTGHPDRALALFADVLQLSTLSETQYNYACLLAEQGRAAEAREWADKILRKKPTMPTYLRRRERPWFRKAKALMKKSK
jgi:hypothetical protein